ncbi:MAG: hypothetical protein M3169_06140 [Candidatus Eremiobacteraeota bacterium]|nr:hypothetical protein [Candidatus Eremiobacteraeota bacterium]
MSVFALQLKGAFTVIQISVNNTDTDDIFVVMTDTNTSPPSVVIDNARLNQGSSPKVVSVQEDGNGQGGVTWRATRATDSTISHQGAATPSNLDTVNVYVQ